MWDQFLLRKGAFLCFYSKSLRKFFQNSYFTELFQVTASEYVEKTWTISIFVSSNFFSFCYSVVLLQILQFFFLNIPAVSENFYCIYRNSFPKVLFDKAVFENFTKFTGKELRFDCSFQKTMQFCNLSKKGESIRGIIL